MGWGRLYVGPKGSTPQFGARRLSRRSVDAFGAQTWRLKARLPRLEVGGFHLPQRRDLSLAKGETMWRRSTFPIRALKNPRLERARPPNGSGRHSQRMTSFKPKATLPHPIGEWFLKPT